MTTTFPQLKLKTLVNFPTAAVGRNGINVDNANSSYFIDIDYSTFNTAPAFPPGAYTLTWNPITDVYLLAVPEGASPSDLTPLADALGGGPGVSALYSRADHVHPASASAASTGIEQNSQSADYTLVLGDAQKHIFHPAADTTARTWTVPSNASVAYPIGTAITFVNQNGAGVITIAITADTMWLSSTGLTGDRTLAANGVCTALKIGTTEWIISGKGIT